MSTTQLKRNMHGGGGPASNDNPGSFKAAQHAERSLVGPGGVDSPPGRFVDIQDDQVTVNGVAHSYERKAPATYAQAAKSLKASNRRGSGKARIVDLGFLNGKRPQGNTQVEAPKDGAPMIINTHGMHRLEVMSGNVVMDVTGGYGGSVEVHPGATLEIYVGARQKIHVDNLGGDVNVRLHPEARCFLGTSKGGRSMVSGTAERSVVMGDTEFLTGNESMFRAPYSFAD
jgi:hypothetical protein